MTAPHGTDLVGRTFVITGGNAGLGYFAAEQLAARGARTVIAARNPSKAAIALESLRRHATGPDPLFVGLDLADLASVKAAGTELAELGPIHGLIANAGITSAARGSRTVDGFELMLGTNHLGHFALIAAMLPALRATPGARIVHLGSISHEFFRLQPDDLMNERRFWAFRAYGRSKLAVMTFGFELDRRFRAAGDDTRSLVAHPGLALDTLTPDRPGITPVNTSSRPIRRLYGLASQGKDAGARPIVAAATDDRLSGGEYVGPGGWRQLHGAPRVVVAKPWSRNVPVAQQLWTASEELTGTRLII